MAAGHQHLSDFHVYDTTMRDGAQQEGLNLSVQDKLHIARHLDDLGVGYIEGGWPGSNPKDTEFFALAAKELDLEHATLAAFGATRRPDGRAADDDLIAALRESGASVVTLVAKSHDRHVELALRTTLEENLAMVRDTVEHLRSEGQRVFVDCEHFFNGYLENRDYALEVVRAAADAGAEVVVLCDTNGGMLPHQVGEIVTDVMATGARIGIHAHNDTGCAVANSMAAVLAGATHLQGCINGYGERTGNADLITSAANLELKLGMKVLPEGRLARGHPDRARDRRDHQLPAVGAPAVHRRLVLRAQGGPARQCHPGRPQPVPARRPRPGGQRHAAAGLGDGWSRHDRAQGQGARLRPRRRPRAARPPHRPSQGHGATGLHVRGGGCVIRAAARGRAGHPAFVLRHRVVARARRVPTLDTVGVPSGAVSEATVKLRAGGQRLAVIGEGNGPVNALDHALRQAIEQLYPDVARFHLIDFRVRILDQGHGTDAVTRVLIETTDGKDSWVTVGVGANIIEASWEALLDAMTYGLRLHQVAPQGA